MKFKNSNYGIYYAYINLSIFQWFIDENIGKRKNSNIIDKFSYTTKSKVELAWTNLL